MKVLNNWEEIEIGKMAECLDGDWILSENMSEKGEFGIVQLKHIGEGKFLSKNFNFITTEVCKKLKCTVLEEGDLLVSRMAEPICRSCILPKLEFRTVTAVDITIVRPNVELVDTNFLNLIFNSYVIKNQTAKYTTGTTRSRISRKNLEKLKIPLPPLKVQKSIVSILEKAEKLKEMRYKANELTKNYLKAVFFEMFGDPTKNSKKMKISTLGEVCISIKDGPHESPNYVKKGIPFLSVNNIIDGYWNLENVRYISPEDHERFKKKCNPQKGDILYTKGGTTGFAKYIDVDFEFSNWVHLAVLKFNKNTINGRFLESMLNSNYCFQQARHYTRGIANKDLVLNQMKKIKIMVPPIELQSKFDSIIQNIERMKKYQEQSKEQIENLFNNLMQKAFKGELAC